MQHLSARYLRLTVPQPVLPFALLAGFPEEEEQDGEMLAQTIARTTGRRWMQ